MSTLYLQIPIETTSEHNVQKYSYVSPAEHSYPAEVSTPVPCTDNSQGTVVLGGMVSSGVYYIMYCVNYCSYGLHSLAL